MYNQSGIFNKLHIQNVQDINNPTLAPLIVEGGSIFKKTSLFKSSIIIGPNLNELEGALAYKGGEFLGFNGEKWVSFAKEGHWKEGEGVLFTDGHRIGINKINPKKMLEVGGDVAIDKKLSVKDEVLMEGGFLLGENVGKKRKGMVRFWEGNFEGYDGENWVKFGGLEILPQVEEKKEINLESVDKIRLLNCPLNFSGGNNETSFYYDWDRNEFRLEKLHKNFSGIKLEDLSLGNIKIHGDIIFQEGGRKTIKNISEPILGGDVATKKYVDQMCNGLQNYIVCDYLILEEELLLEEYEMEYDKKLGDFEIGSNIFLKTRSELVEVEEKRDKIKFKLISKVNLPVKLGIISGKYGGSEYIIFSRNKYLQLSGNESLEFIFPLIKNGKEIGLKLDENFYDEKMKIRNNMIENNLLSDSCIESRNLSNNIIESKHLTDNLIEARHLGQKVINSSHLQLKSIGEMHLKDGFLKNNHFTPGIISERELANECIGVTNLKGSIIYQRHLTKGCIIGDNIIDGEIESRHLGERLIDSKHLREKIILSENLSNNLIKNEHLGEKIVEGKHLMDNIISGEHLKNGIVGREHIIVNAINGLHIQENSIMGSHLKEQTIGSRNLQMKCILDWHLSEKIIGDEHIRDGSIDGSKIGEKVLEERHFVEGSIGGNLIRKNSINSNHLGVNSVDDKHLSNYCIKNSKLVDGCISESKISDNSVSTSKIKDGSVTNDKIRLPFLKVQTDPAFTCTQMVNLGETLVLGLNQNYMIPKRRDGVVEFMSSIKFGEEGGGQKMYVNMDMEVKSEVNFMGEIRQRGVGLSYIGEIRSFWGKIKLDDNFMRDWVRCDGKRVKRNDYPELSRVLGEEEEFYLPDIKGENIEYYMRVR